jgi:hypothetical protein
LGGDADIAESEGGMSDPGQDFRDVMSNWRDWNRRSDSKLGYPPRSLMLTGDGVVSGESYSDIPQSEAYAGLDAEEAEKVQVCVDDLPRIECSAVYNHWLSTSRSIGGASPELAYASAVTLLRIAFNRRGVLRT